MANKKITVVGDGAEEPLTPEEEHKIEVKIDRMLDPKQPDEPATKAAKKPTHAKQEPTPKPKANVTKIITKFADEPDEPVESIEESKIDTAAEDIAPVESVEPLQSAPPIPKASRKILIKEHDEPAEESPLVADKPSEDDTTITNPKPKTTKIITKFADDSEPEQVAEPVEVPADEVEEPRATSPDFDAIQAAALAAEAKMQGSTTVEADTDEAQEDDTSQEESEESTLEETIDQEEVEKPEPKRIITKFVDETPDVPDKSEEPEELGPIEEPEEIVEPSTEEPVETPKTLESPKPTKPDPLPALRPIEFPRAKPAPTEEIIDDLTQAASSDPLSAEDAAIAHAFDTKEVSGGQRLSKLRAAIFSAKALRTVLVLVVLVAIITPLAMPKVRTKLTHYVHTLHSSLTSKKPNPAATKTTLTVASATPPVNLKDVYMAKQSGTYNVYKTDIDGQNQQLLLAGTGNEQASDLTLATNPSDTSAALVSNRTKAADTLTTIDIASGATQTVDQADQIKLVDWFGDRIVYTLIKAETTDSDPSRYQLISYDVETKQRIVLDHANYLNDVLSAEGAVYYATSSQLIKVLPDGSGKQVLLNQEVWRIYRTDYSDLALATTNTWYNYKLGDSKPTTTNGAYTGKGRLYIDSIDGTHSLWIDDSKNTLMSYDVATGKDTVLASDPALTYPVRWLGANEVVYQTTASTQTSDYAVDIAGGAPKVITLTLPVNGISLWFQ